MLQLAPLIPKGGKGTMKMESQKGCAGAKANASLPPDAKKILTSPGDFITKICLFSNRVKIIIRKINLLPIESKSKGAFILDRSRQLSVHRLYGFDLQLTLPAVTARSIRRGKVPHDLRR